MVVRAILLSVAALAAGTAVAVGSGASFPASLYPAPIPATPGHAVSLCPNPSGLERFTVQATNLALQAAAAYDRKSLETDLRNSDRAWWPQLRRMWTSGHPQKSFAAHTVLGSEPTAKSGYAIFMGPACGASTLANSLMVTIGPRPSSSGPHCVACNSHLFFIDRRGQPRIYYLY